MVRWGGGRDAIPPCRPVPASFAGLTGDSIAVQCAGGAMHPLVKPEGDGGWVGVSHGFRIAPFVRHSPA